jgi:hypothetical protein
MSARIDITITGEQAEEYQRRKEIIEERLGHGISWPDALARMVEPPEDC